MQNGVFLFGRAILRHSYVLTISNLYLCSLALFISGIQGATYQLVQPVLLGLTWFIVHCEGGFQLVIFIAVYNNYCYPSELGVAYVSVLQQDIFRNH